jgi:hypothetical protein
LNVSEVEGTVVRWYVAGQSALLYISRIGSAV